MTFAAPTNLRMEPTEMGAAKVIERLAAWAAAAALLAAAPAAGQRLPPDTVKVEWARSSDGSLVILNAYAVRGGRPDPESVRGLIIEPDPVAAAKHGYLYGGPDVGYAQTESAPFIRALGFSEVTLDTLANGAMGSQFKSVLSAREWAGLLNRLLVEQGTEIAEGEHRVIVSPVSPAVQSLLAKELESLFKDQDQPNPVFPHLKSGLLALSAGPVGARIDSVLFGSVTVQDTGHGRLYLRNYGVRPVRAELDFSEGPREARFGVNARFPLVVEPGDSTEVPFDFTPSKAGSYSETVGFLAGGRTAAQVVLLGEGKSPGILTDVRKWLADWWGWLLAFLVLALVGVPRVARMFGVWVAFPRFRRMWTALKPVRRRTEPPSHSSAAQTAPVVRTDGESVRRQLVTARVAIQEALAALGEDGDGSSPHGAGGSGAAYPERNAAAAEHVRRLHDLERENIDLREARSGMEERVRVLTADREALAGRVRTLEVEEARLTQQVGVLQGVRAENDELRRKQAAAENEAAGLRRQVEHASREQEKLGSRLTALAEVLDLSAEMVSDAGWSQTQRGLAALREGGKPRYVWNFEQMVVDLVAIFEEIASRAGEGRLAAAVSAVLAGSNNNAGLRTVAAALEREALVKRLDLAHARELRTLPAERFYRDFVDRWFRPVIDNIAKLGSYARSRSRDIGMDELLSREGVDPALLERALTLIETRLAVDFGVEVQMPRLFEDRFDASRHETAQHSTLRLTLPDLEPSIRRLPPDTIYDITSVGLRSNALGVSVRPVVARVAAH